MKALLLTLLHLTVMTATLCGPGGVRAVIAENLLLKQQLLVLRRPRGRAPRLTASDRLLFGFGSLFLSPGRIRKVAIGVRPSTLLAFHQALVRRKYRRLFSSSECPKQPGPKGPSEALIQAIVELTSRTPRFGCPRIARIISRTFGANIDKNVVYRVAPDYTTLSRRSQHLRRRLRRVPPGEGLHLVLDRTGLSIVGAGEWAAAKHGGRGRRGWRKLHRGVDQSGVIRVHTLTEATGDDATTGLDLLTAVEGPLVRVTADAAYDTVAVYETAGARGATVVVPPARTANVSGHGPRSPARDRTITLVKQLGRRQWKRASGYHRQGRVENAFFRYKSIIGDGLRARSPAGQGSEVVLGCEILNRMTALGRPVSYRIGR